MNHPQSSIGEFSFRGLIGAATEDVTPPVGIYARCWGAAKHDVAAGVHRPLELACIAFQSSRDESPLLLITLDLMTWRSREDEWALRGAILDHCSLEPSNILICASHSHSAPGMRSEDADRPGGHLIAAQQAKLQKAGISAARRAISALKPATLTWRYGRCNLATNRDLTEPAGSRLICGYNPLLPADDALLVGRVCDDQKKIVATIVNYACHPTTLGPGNALISPDYVGAMRHVVQSHTDGAPCAFIQGASGELAPAEQYVADPLVADAHGRCVGFAALSTLESMNPACSRLAYHGVIESGAPLAAFRQTPALVSDALCASMSAVELSIKPMPTASEFEAQWKACDDPVQKERLWRKRGVRKVVGDGQTCQMPLWIWRLGDAFIVGHPNEAYSVMQTTLRASFPNRAVVVGNLVNGSAGYLVPRELCDRDSYQVNQTPFAPGSLEQVIGEAERAMSSM
jgi:hypothetical protein